MSYSKFTVDNTTCSRRFHITFDDEAEKLPRVELRCQYCNVVIFAEDDHPPIRLAREENLVKTSALSDLLVRDCDFSDSLSKKTIAQSKDLGPMYPDHATRK